MLHRFQIAVFIFKRFPFKPIGSKLKAVERWFGLRLPDAILCHRLPVSACALATGFWFPRANHPFHVFPRLPLVTCFPALTTDGMLALTRLPSISRVPCLFSRAYYRFHVFPRLTSVPCFSRFLSISCLPVLGTSCVFLLRVLISLLRYFRLLREVACENFRFISRQQQKTSLIVLN